MLHSVMDQHLKYWTFNIKWVMKLPDCQMEYFRSCQSPWHLKGTYHFLKNIYLGVWPAFRPKMWVGGKNRNVLVPLCYIMIPPLQSSSSRHKAGQAVANLHLKGHELWCLILSQTLNVCYTSLQMLASFSVRLFWCVTEHTCMDGWCDWRTDPFIATTSAG